MLGSSGWVKGRMLTREILGSGRNCIGNVGPFNMRRAWRHPSYVREKETAMCRNHIDGTVVHVLREIMPERVLKLVRGLYPNPPDTPYLFSLFCR